MIKELEGKGYRKFNGSRGTGILYSENDLVYRRENLYFALLLIVSIMVYIAMLISIVGIAILAGIFLFYWFIHNLSMVNIRKNGVKVSEQQFSAFYAQAREVAERMKLKEVPDIYVMQSGGVLNAFAARFGLKNMVVLYSDVFALLEEQGEEEVLYILAHEFAHIKRKHVGYGWLLMPGLILPFLGNAYSRACEFTCDRYGAYYSQSFEGAKNALVILAIGPQLYRKVDQTVFMQQISAEGGMFSWMDELMSTHPNLPRRIHSVSAFFNNEDTPEIQTSKRGIVLGIAGLVLASVLLFAGVWWGFKQFEESFLLNGIFSDEELTYTYDTSGMTELMLAVVEGDMEALKEYAADTAMLNEVNDEGYTALHLAVMESNHEAAEYLLTQGADPNTMDIYEFTPLMEAVTYDDLLMTELLLTYGADKTITNSQGYDAYGYALDYGYTDIAQYIQNF